ncbi:MAG TPA: hypothetical protein VF384_08150 [Planctomycetota bacterium]
MTAERESASGQLARRAARTERITRLYQQRHRLLLAAGLFVCVAVSLAAWVWASPGSSPARTAGSKLVSSELDAVLQQLRSRLSQTSVAHVVPKSLTAERCERELPAVLADRASPVFRSAVLLAEHFEIASLAPLLRAAMPAFDAETNHLLVRALERLQPWSGEDLKDLLKSEAPGVAEAALWVCRLRTDAPQPQEIASPLSASEPEVRAAALETLPAELTAEWGNFLAAQLQWIPTNQAGETLQALARCPQSPAIERLLYERLVDHSAPCDQVLTALAQSGRPLTRASAVLAIVTDASRSVATRARALYCLERTGAAVDPATLSSIWPEHPALDYFAARQLLLAGKPAGVQLLVRILDSSAEDEPGQRLVAEARIGARQLLAHLTDTSPFGDPGVWREWANSMPAPTIQSLPAPRVDLNAAHPAR